MPSMQLSTMSCSRQSKQANLLEVQYALCCISFRQLISHPEAQAAQRECCLYATAKSLGCA